MATAAFENGVVTEPPVTSTEDFSEDMVICVVVESLNAGHGQTTPTGENTELRSPSDSGSAIKRFSDQKSGFGFPLQV